MLLKTSFLLPHLLCNALVSQHRIAVREFNKEMLLEFQNKTNIEIIEF